MGLNVGKNFHLVADRWPSRTAIIDEEGRTHTYRNLDEKVNAVGSGLRDRGVDHGTQVAVHLPNSLAFVLTYLACQKLGAVTVATSTQLSANDVKYMVTDAEADLLVYDADFEDNVRQAIDQGIDSVEVGGGTFDAFLDNSESPVPCPADRGDDSIIIYTSGSTGQPKGVPHTHDDVIMGADQVIQEMSITRHDRVIHVIPLFHTVSLHVFFNPHWFMGATSVLQKKWDPAGALELIEEHGVEGILAVPLQLKALMDELDSGSYDVSSLEFVRTGAPITQGTVDRITDLLAEDFYNTYGLSEAQQNVTVFTPDDPPSKATSVGKAAPFWDVRVVETNPPETVDPDAVVDPPGRGVLLLDGPSVTDGYLNRPDADEEAFVDGWLYTGDIADRDEDGYIYIVDRIDNMIKSGGQNVYPQEIERVLGDHPDVADCGVVGTRSEQYGEAVSAAVVLEPDSVATKDDLDIYLKESDSLADFKRPRRYVFVDEIPRNASGSIVRTELETRFE